MNMTRIDELLGELTVDEKAAMVAGVDLWHTAAVERLGIPALKVTDGPIGARGERWTGGQSAAFPCGTALGATWDTDLIEEVGQRIGNEARRKQCHVLLAPTVNTHRHPLAGRNFECYSEDPSPHGARRGRLHHRCAVAERRLFGQALRRERLRVRAHDDQLRGGRPHAARDLVAAVRSGGARGRRVVGHVRVQPSERSLLQRAAVVARHAVEAGVGVRRPGDVGLVRHTQHRAGRQRGARSRDARAAGVVRAEARAKRCATARSTRSASTTWCGACSRSSNGRARWTIRRSGRKSPSTTRSTVMSRGAPRRAASSCCRTGPPRSRSSASPRLRSSARTPTSRT